MSRGPRVAVVVPAGGAGRRMGGGSPKQYLPLAGEPVLVRALRPFLAEPCVEWVVVALPEDDVAAPPVPLPDDPRLRCVAGGRERGDSVAAALAAVPDEADVVLVHDAARPLVTRDVVRRVIDEAATGVGAVAAVPVRDTIKRVGERGVVIDTPERGELWQAQTPQGFPRAMLLRAYGRAQRERVLATDDAALVERYGGVVRVVEGSPENLKVTRPEDVAIAEALLARR